MYWPGSNYKANERILAKRSDRIEAERDAEVRKLRAELEGVMIGDVDLDEEHRLVIVYVRRDGSRGKMVVSVGGLNG